MSLAGISSWSFRNRWATVGIWIVVLVGTNFLGKSVGNDYCNSQRLPGTESQRAADLLTEHGFVDDSGNAIFVVVSAKDGLDDPVVEERIEKLLADLGTYEHIGRVELAE